MVACGDREATGAVLETLNAVAQWVAKLRIPGWLAALLDVAGPAAAGIIGAAVFLLVLLAALALIGIGFNVVLGGLHRVPGVRRVSSWLAVPNLLVLRASRYAPAPVIYVALLLFAVGLAAMIVQMQHPELNQPGLARDPERSWANALYRGLTLLAFGADWTLPAATPPDGAVLGPQLGWQLQTIRFALPILAIAGLFVTLIKGAGNWLQRQIMPRRGHTVLCGLGEAGTAYIQHLSRLGALLRHGPIVVVERDAANPSVALCRSLGVPVIVDDALSESGRALRRARVRRADRVIGLLREDAANVQFVLRVQQVVSRQEPALAGAIGRGLAHARRWLAGCLGSLVEQPLPRVIAQVNEPQLAHRLENYEKIAQYSRADVRFYNIHAIQAQQLILRYPPERFADLFGQRTPRIAIYGFGRLGQQVFSEAIRLCQYLPGEPPRFTILDRDAGRVRRVLEQEFPEIARDSEVGRQVAVVRSIIEVTVNPPALTEAMLRELFANQAVVTQHVICFGDEATAVSLGLALRDQLLERRGANAPIFVRTKRARGMAALLDSNSGQREIPDGLYPFATLETALEPRALDNGWLEDVAQVLHHYGYMRVDAATGTARPADQPWERLDDLHRRGTRHAVLHTDAKLRAHGLKRFPIPHRSPEWRRDNTGTLFAGCTATEHVAASTDEPQPALEHRRYVAARLADGWQQADTRTDALRRHTVFVPYDDLPGRMQKNDRRMTAVLPAAVTGDRALAVAKAGGDPLENAAPTVRRSLVRAFDKLAQDAQAIQPERRIGVIGPIGLCTAGHLTLGGIQGAQAVGDPIQQIDAWLAAKDPFDSAVSRHAALATRGVTLVTPLMHALERAAASRLYDRLIRRETVVENPELFWARRVEIEALLPLPYDFLRERAATVLLGVQESGDAPAAQKKPIEDAAVQAQETLWDLLGQPHVRYTEMPLLAASGLKLAVPPETHRMKPDGTREVIGRHPNGCPDHEAAHRWYQQWRLTLAYLFHRCDEIIVIPAPDGVPDGLDELAGWRDDPSTIPNPVGWASTGLFPAPGARPGEPAAPGTPRPVVSSRPRDNVP